MSGPIEAYFNEIDFDFLEDIVFSNELDDCYLSEDELQQFTTPCQEAWTDLSPTTFGAVFQLDGSKDFQWQLAQEEIAHVKARLSSLIGIESPSHQDIIRHCIGPESELGILLQKELQISSEVYLKFMSTFTVSVLRNFSAQNRY